MTMNVDLLDWFSNFLNFLIFAYLALTIINTQCFNVSQMSLSLIGLLASIFVQVIALFIRWDIK